MAYTNRSLCMQKSGIVNNYPAQVPNDFIGLSLDLIGANYLNNEILLSKHLMDAGLLQNHMECTKCGTPMVC